MKAPALLVLLGALAAAAGAADLPEPALVAPDVRGPVRAELDRARSDLVERRTALARDLAAHNRDCGRVSTRDRATMERCRQRMAELRTVIWGYLDAVAAFDRTAAERARTAEIAGLLAPEATARDDELDALEKEILGHRPPSRRRSGDEERLTNPLDTGRRLEDADLLAPFDPRRLAVLSPEEARTFILRRQDAATAAAAREAAEELGQEMRALERQGLLRAGVSLERQRDRSPRLAAAIDAAVKRAADRERERARAARAESVKWMRYYLDHRR